MTTRATHIIMLTRVLPHHNVGGMQAIAWDLARRFAANGCRVSVVTSAIANREEEFVESGVRVYALPGTSWRRPGARWWAGSRKIFVERLSADCDVVFSVSSAGFGLLSVRKRFPKIPFVMQAHGTSIGEFMSKMHTPSIWSFASSVKNVVWFFKDIRAYRQFDTVVGVGPRVTGELMRFPYVRMVNSSLIRGIPNGIDTAIFRPDSEQRAIERARRGFGPNEKIIVSASRLHKQKGLQYGLAAFAKLAKEDASVRYVIAGDGPARPRLEKYAESLGISARVDFIGAVTRRNLAALLCACDVMLFTSVRVEGLALNVLEAMATGLPAVMSDHLYDDAIYGSSVLPVAPSDVSAISSALATALQAGVSATSRLPAGFSLDECANTYLQLLHDLLNRLG